MDFEPFFLFIAVNDGPHRSCRLTLEEQRTQVLMNGTTELLSYIFLCNYVLACIMVYSDQFIIISQMTLWAMAKSPLMYGGDVRKIDNATYEIITNPTLLEINHFSSNNKEA